MIAEAAIGERTMARGGRRKVNTEPERRCIVTGDSQPVTGLIRFVLSPDGCVVPDISGSLPGRGAWVSADRAALERAVAKRLFSRAFKQSAKIPDDLPALVEKLLARRLVDLISLARKAGQAVTGSEKVKARLAGGGTGALLQASDGAADGRAKLSRLAQAVGEGDIVEIECLTSVELGLAFGRDFAIHAALDSGGFAERICAQAQQLSGLRTDPGQGATERTNPNNGQAGGGGAARL